MNHRLLVITRCLMYGGSQTRYLTFAEALRRNGGGTTILAGDGPLAARARAAGELRIVPWYDLRLDDARRVVTEAAAGHTIAILTLEPWSLPLVATLARHVPVLLALEQRPGPERFGFGSFAGRALAARLAALHASGRVALVASSSDQARDHADSLGLPRSAIRPVINGIHVSAEPAGASSGPIDSVTLVCRLNPDKLPLVTAAADLAAAARADGHPVRLAVHGEGPGRGAARRTIAQRLPRGAWETPGATGAPSLVLRQADVVVGTGRAAIEALAAGRRVVVAKSLPDRSGQLGPPVTPDNFDVLAADNFSWRTREPLRPEEVWRRLTALTAADVEAVRDRARAGFSAQAMLAQALAAAEDLEESPGEAAAHWRRRSAVSTGDTCAAGRACSCTGWIVSCAFSRRRSGVRGDAPSRATRCGGAGAPDAPRCSPTSTGAGSSAAPSRDRAPGRASNGRRSYAATFRRCCTASA